MKTQLKKVAVVALFGTIFIGQSVPAYAAIPVIDGQNIAQQIKTYTETLNVVTNTAKQIELQLKELLGLPDDLLDKYETALKTSIDSVTGSLKKSKFFQETADWDNYWRSTYPKISSGNYASTILSEHDVKTSIHEMLSMKNQQDVTSYHELMDSLAKSTERLQDLLEQSKNPEGSKQALQLANEIAVEKAHIESINVAIQAISSQNKAMKNQADVLEKQNHQAVVDASVQAESTALSSMHSDAKPNYYGSAVDNPWVTYGKASW